MRQRRDWDGDVQSLNCLVVRVSVVGGMGVTVAVAVTLLLGDLQGQFSLSNVSKNNMCHMS